MKAPVLIVTVIATVLGSGLLITAATPQDDASLARNGQQEESARKVKELQRERIGILREMADVTHSLFRNARVNSDRAYEAKQILLTAEVDAAENDSDRIKLYEKFVDAMKEYEQIATARTQGAQGTYADVLKAKAIRLEAEIALERMRVKATK